MSTQELASISGVTKRTIERIEKGTANPTIMTLCRLAKALGIETNELYSCESETKEDMKS